MLQTAEALPQKSAKRPRPVTDENVEAVLTAAIARSGGLILQIGKMGGVHLQQPIYNHYTYGPALVIWQRGVMVVMIGSDYLLLPSKEMTQTLLDCCQSGKLEDPGYHPKNVSFDVR